MNRHALFLAPAAILLCAAGAAHAQFADIIDPLNPTFTQALGINNSGTIVGYGNATTFNGFVLSGGTFTRENPLGLPTQVTGIDAAGDTVGFVVTNTTVGTTLGFGQPVNGGPFAIAPTGSQFSQVLGVNQIGNEVVGYTSTDPTGQTGQQAFSYNFSTFTNINALLPPNFNSQATGVDNAGTVVGFFQYDAAGDFYAFTDTAGTITPFEFPGSTSTQALGINDTGEIVGDYVLNGETFGFLDQNGVFITINPPGAVSSTANGVGDNGQIVGFFTDANDTVIGFVTVPEPSTWALIGIGFAGVAFVSARPRRARLPSRTAQAVG